MDLLTLGNITISRDWLTPIGVALVLLSFYWFRVALLSHQAPCALYSRLAQSNNRLGNGINE